MLTMLKSLIPGPWLALGAVLAIGTAFGAGYVKGRSDGAARAEIKNLQSTIDQIRERNATDAEISTMSDADICRLLGGVFERGQCN